MYVPFIFLKKKVYIPLYFYSLPFYITFWKSICFFFQKLEKTCQNQHRKTRPIQYTYRLHDRKFGFERKPNIRIRYSDARHASWVKDWSKALFSIFENQTWLKHYHLQVQANPKKLHKKTDAIFSIYGENGIMPWHFF